jgi:hypothetical protein
MAEAQALDRVHRMGQQRDVVTTRYIANNSIETACTNVLTLHRKNITDGTSTSKLFSSES